MLRAELAVRVGAVELNVAFEVAAGSCLALAGPSGAGKTSILRAVAGLLAPARGSIACDGVTWLDTDGGIDLAPERRGCAVVFQDYALFEQMSTWRNVAYGLRGVERSRRRAQALALLERFGVSARADERPAALSGGERQRVALARALAARPGALLLDEGRIVQRGTAAELAARPASAFVADFTGAVVLSGRVRAGDGGAGAARLTRVELDGGGSVASTDLGEGPVAVAVHPWEIAIEPAGTVPRGSPRNRLDVEVVSVTTIGNRVRVGLAAPQPLAAEITHDAAQQLGIAPGVRGVATWKAAATRLLAR